MRIHLLKPHDINPSRWYGVSRYATQMVLAMRRLDPAIEFVSFAFSLRGRMADDRRRALEQAGVRIHNARLPDVSRLTPYHRLLERHVLPALVDRAACDISWGTNCVALRKGRRRFRTVVTIHDLFLLTHPALSETHFTRLVAPRLRRTAQEADLILTDSHFTGRQIVELLAVPAEKVVVTHLGVSEEIATDPATQPGREEGRNTQSDASRTQWLTKIMGLPVENPPILSVGTIEPRKNYERGLEAYCLLQRRLAPPPLWLIVGHNGWKFGRFYALRREWGLEAQVRVLQDIDDQSLAGLYRCARCLFCPSLVEGFGLPVLEAMHAGLPVVTSTGGALPEVGGEAVLSFDPYDTEAMAEQLDRACTDPDLATQLASRGRLRSGHFSWRKAAQTALEAFRKLAPSVERGT
ncbi:MAG: glycosyltransferase family 4 protein [Planctomycetes bacterium]|nr:glycosyltransferase family 4 protein [Planctomycetota bacterium]